jgi:hypothetical protein
MRTLCQEPAYMSVPDAFVKENKLITCRICSAACKPLRTTLALIHVEAVGSLGNPPAGRTPE